MIGDERRAGAGPGGHSGAALSSSAAGSTPNTSSSDKSLPGPATASLRPHPRLDRHRGGCRWGMLTNHRSFAEFYGCRAGKDPRQHDRCHPAVGPRARPEGTRAVSTAAAPIVEVDVAEMLRDPYPT